jgi:hypothetical protein
LALVLIVGLGLLAGVLAWLVGERTMNYARPSLAASENYRDRTALNAEMPRVDAINGALTFGALGAFLGLALGVGGGLTRLSLRGALIGAVAGVVLGTAAGVLPALAVMPWHWRHRNDDPSTTELLVPLLMHAALWSAAGLAAGLAFGIGRGAGPARLLGAAFAGLVGALIGTFVFEMAGAFLFPYDHTPDPFSSTVGTRLLARLCVAAFVALAVIPETAPARSRVEKGAVNLNDL